MKCYQCGNKTKVVDIEYPYQGDTGIKKRRHECLDCGRRFNSFQEYADVGGGGEKEKST